MTEAWPGPDTAQEEPGTEAMTLLSHECSQVGCDGNIATDGHCDSCGLAVEVPGLTPEQGLPTTGSVRLESVPLGSRRSYGEDALRRRLARRRPGPSEGLGGGLTEIAEAPRRDPLDVILDDPVVPERRRFCSACRAAVGRARGATPGPLTGTCQACEHPFNFVVGLRRGDVVGRQYEVAGAIAHGGMGWVYLARDRLVSDRWVVLKGLLNSEDAMARQSADAEKQSLARTSHPNIVRIYNFTRHAGSGYIVMEYVGGRSLRSSRLLPVDHALAYAAEVLRALGYLHSTELLFCDLKPDNIIHVGNEVKLIDLGGVRELSDRDSPIHGTRGYQAPEVRFGPSVSSDLYTVGRTLLRLTCKVPGFSEAQQFRIPPPDGHPALSAHDSFHRLLLKTCAAEPADRFLNAEEMRLQVLGVQREVTAARRTPDVPAQRALPSTAFAAPPANGTRGAWHELPEPLPDRSDPGAVFLESLSETDPAARLETLRAGRPDSVDLTLERARTMLHLDPADPRINTTLQDLLVDHPWQWRAAWWLGVTALARGSASDARSAFNAVYGELPGELAPKLALGFACELSGELEKAEGFYRTCVRTDAAYVSAGAFGLARLGEARDDLPGALSALELIPPSAGDFVVARHAEAELLARAARDRDDLDRALRVAALARLEPLPHARLRVRILRRALELEATAEHRSGLEQALRDLARLIPDRRERHAIVDEANQVRPWSRT